MSPFLTALGLATLAGAAIPAGGLLARWDAFLPSWVETELRHTIIAFGGGILLAAVALVLVPDGLEFAPQNWGLCAFAAGGGTFLACDWMLTRRGGSAGQFLAMLLDFVPEALALGAAFALDKRTAPLLAVFITLQNLPEAFNAARELGIADPGGRGRRIFWLLLLVPLGPLSAWAGYEILAEATMALGLIMLFAAGGILYLVFQDIAPQAALEEHWAPPLGAVAGFLAGMTGEQFIAY